MDNPYGIDPAAFLQSLLAPYTPQHVNLPQLTPASYHGPAHQALTEAFHAALGRNNAAPGLLSAMTNDPALASQVGGFSASGGSGLLSAAPAPWNYQTWLASQPKAIQQQAAAMAARTRAPAASTGFDPATSGMAYWGADGGTGPGDGGAGASAAADGAAASAAAAASGNDGSSGTW